MKKLGLALLFVASSALAQDVPPAIVGIQVPTVFDANGIAIGQLLTIEGGTGTILFKIADPDAVVPLRIGRNAGGEVGWVGNGDVVFSQPDCRGEAATTGFYSLGDFYAAVDADGVLVVADLTAPLAHFQSASRMTPQGCEQPFLMVGPMRPMVKKLKMSDHFKTPLRVDNMHKARIRATGR